MLFLSWRDLSKQLGIKKAAPDKILESGFL